MDKENLKDLIKNNLKDIPKIHKSSAALILRPNYLLFFSTKKFNDEKFQEIENLKTSYLSFENTSPLRGLLVFLLQIEAGAYVSSQTIEDKMFLSDTTDLSIFLVDPHNLDEFENDSSFCRIGVLIRKKILACQDFQIEIHLS